MCTGVERSQKMIPPGLQFDSKNQEFETGPNDAGTSGPYIQEPFWILWGFKRFVTIKTLDLMTLKTYLQFLKVEHFIGYDYIRNLNFRGLHLYGFPRYHDVCFLVSQKFQTEQNCAHWNVFWIYVIRIYCEELSSLYILWNSRSAGLSLEVKIQDLMDTKKLRCLVRLEGACR